MGRYGTKGGTSATAGRKAETICAEVFGQTYTKRVFFGQRFLVVSQADADSEPMISAWPTHADAMRHSEQVSHICPVAMVLEAHPC